MMGCSRWLVTWRHEDDQRERAEVADFPFSVDDQMRGREHSGNFVVAGIQSHKAAVRERWETASGMARETSS